MPEVFSTVEEAIEAIGRGEIVIVVDSLQNMGVRTLRVCAATSTRAYLSEETIRHKTMEGGKSVAISANQTSET